MTPTPDRSDADPTRRLADRLNGLFVMAAALAVLVAVGQLARGRAAPVAIGIPLAIAAAALGARRLPASVRVSLVVALPPVLLLAFAADLALGILEGRALAVEDPRPIAQVVRDWRAEGRHDAVAPSKGWAYLAEPLLVDGVPTIPVAGLPHALEVLCNEGGSWRGYRTDRFGFTNPDAVWDAPADLVLVGDSFTQGFCVSEADSFAGRVRAVWPATVNLGGGANGPLIELATLAEFGARTGARTVLWFFYEGNDLDGLLREAEQPLLTAYLEPGGSQQLLGRIAAVQRAQRESAEHRMDEWFEGPEAPGAWNELLRVAKLGHLRERFGLLRKAPHPFDALDADAARALFPRVARRIADVAAANDATVLLVYLPCRDAITARGSHPLRPMVLESARAAGIETLDLTDPFAAAPEAERLFTSARFWSHYGVEGNRVVADAVLAALARRERAAADR